MAKVLIVHGWSDNSSSFHPLRDFLVANSISATDIWLADYLSLDDDVEVQDVVRRMDAVIQDMIGRGALTEPFDMIVHSTGGLVAREWLARQPLDKPAPVKRLLMLAPANFGSKLAALGKSMVGRVMRGWDNWFQTGEQMLRALELGSPYQWNLTLRDLLSKSVDAAGPYGPARTWPFVIIGSRGYAEGLRQIVNEDGSDGTVRVAAANMNVVGLTLDFTKGSGDDPVVSTWTSRVRGGPVPFAVLPERDHGLIVHPEQHASISTGGDRLAQLILQALRCQTTQEYDQIRASWDKITEETGALASNDAAREDLFPSETPPGRGYDQFFQVLTWVHDDDGYDVDDYFLEFYSPGSEGEQDSVILHSDVIADVHTDTVSGAYRCIYLNRNKLLECFYGTAQDQPFERVAMSISAANPGTNIKYFDYQKTGAKGHVIIHAADLDERQGLEARLFHNRTHLVEIVIPRRPGLNVFGLSQNAPA